MKKQLIILGIIILLVIVGLSGCTENTSEPVDESIKLQLYIHGKGQMVLWHIGGPPLINYTIEVKYANGTLIDNTTYRTQDDPWEFHEEKYILPNFNLTADEGEVEVTVYNIHDDGSVQIVFYESMRMIEI